MLDQPAQVVRPLGRHRDEPPTPRLHLLHVRAHLRVDVILRRHEHYRHRGIDQRDRAVLHLRRRVALGMDVGDLLELQGTLERGGEIHAPPQVQEIPRVGEARRQRPHFRLERQGARHQLRQLDQAAHQLPALLRRQPPRPPEIQPQQRQRRDLRRERLGRRHADLGARVQVDPAPALARDGTPHHVDDPHHPRSRRPCRPQRFQRVRGLPRL